MPTLSEVAKEAGVSTVTASSVLSGANRVRVSSQTSQRIIDTARKMNYVPRAAARGLRTGRVQAVGFVTHPRIYWQPHWQEILRGISDLLWDRGERLILSLPQTEEQEEEVLRQLAFGHQVDALIVQNADPSQERVRLLKESGVPFVSLDGDPSGQTHVVVFDMKRFGSILTQNLIRSTGAVALLSGKADSPSKVDFSEGCTATCQENNTPFSNWISAFLPEKEELLALRQQAGEKPCGILLTRHLLPELLGLIDSAELVLGVDVRISYLAGAQEILLPPKGLDVAHLDYYTLGREAAKLMFHLIDEGEAAPPPERKLILPSITEELLEDRSAAG